PPVDRDVAAQRRRATHHRGEEPGAMIIDDGLELLTESECQRLLASNHFGRVGLSIGGLPAIIPVNYCFLDGDVVFRTGPGLKLAAAADGEVVAFEVDDHHPADRSGW